MRRLRHLCVSLAAAEEEGAEAAVESPLAKLRDATAEADYVVSEHLPGPLQVRATRTLDRSVVGSGGVCPCLQLCVYGWGLRRAERRCRQPA